MGYHFLNRRIKAPVDFSVLFSSVSSRRRKFNMAAQAPTEELNKLIGMSFHIFTLTQI